MAMVIMGVVYSVIASFSIDSLFQRVCYSSSMSQSFAVAGASGQFTLRKEAHPFCFVCSGSNPMGLALRYAAEPDGSVSASFLGNCALEGYPGWLHGGVIAALLDGAMTNCLFARGVQGMTAELRVRYREAVAAAETLTVRARLESSSHGLHRLNAEIEQGGKVKATASAAFMDFPA
jgi:acyl-coenzyme A thioesterase PaaI-like protein